MNERQFERAAQGMSDGMARIFRLYGMSPLLGRLYAVLFLSTEPQSLEALCAAVGAAKSSVSVALRKLESARVAKRLPPRTDRRDYYEVVGDPWAVFADWTKHYFSQELSMLRETTDSVLAALDAEGPVRESDTALRARLDTWRDFVEVLASALNATVEKRPVAAARRIRVVVEEDAP